MKPRVEPPPHPYSWRTVAVLVTVHGGALLAPFTFTAGGALLALLLYSLNCLGITTGYHRLLTHRSFKARKWLAYLLVTLGALSAQAGPASWVAFTGCTMPTATKKGIPIMLRTASGGPTWAGCCT